MNGNYLEEWYKDFNTGLNEKINYTELIQGYTKVLEYSDLPDWGRPGLYSDLALLYLESGNVEKGLQVLEKAILLGFNDFFILQGAEAYKQLFEREEFQVLYSKMRISQADALELLWIYTEIQRINHDTNMMIIENMNRPDGDFTQIPQVQIPDRTPQSPTIFSARLKLQMWQRFQKEMVLDSDIQRIGHNTSLKLIKNMGDSTYSDDDYMKEIISRQHIQRQFEARITAVRQREFILPPDASTVPEPCPDLGSI
ncbi:MAG: hypothetical protein ABFD50_00630 [Smithella sp.]